MSRKKLLLTGIAIASLLIVDSSDAGKRRRGGSSGSWGSSGSSGSSGSCGSYGSCGSSGGRVYYSSCGSRGSRGSHGSHGSSGSSGSWGSYGSCGSSGHHHVHVVPVTPVIHTVPSTPVYCPNGKCPITSTTSTGTIITVASTSTSSSKLVTSTTPAIPKLDGKARITMSVPSDAMVYLVGQKMTLTGTERTFTSPVLTPGKDFGYPIRIELANGEKTLAVDAKQIVRANANIDLKVVVADGELKVEQLGDVVEGLSLTIVDEPADNTVALK